MIEVACSDTMQWSFVRSEALQFGAMKTLQEKGVTLHRWPDEILKAFEEKWEEVVAEQNAKDPLFREIHASYTKFRSEYKIWLDRGYLRK
jgi:TRAP-type mannitol/chloroaromatic compound transport system substrate-binding protein